MLRTEIAEVQANMYEIAQKSTYKLNMNTEEAEIAELCDAWVKEVAEKGDPDREIAQFIKRTLNEEVYNAPDELLDAIFERGTVGEFDDYEIDVDPKNTLVAYDAAKGGTVYRSWIDWTVLKPTWKNKQIEVDLSYVDMRKNGWKSVANLTTMAEETLKNSMFFDVFSMADAAVTGGDQLINAGSTTPTLASMDELSLYINDRDSNGTIVTLTRYAQAIRRMPGFAQYLSEAMKDDFNRYGLVKTYDGLGIAAISGAKKMANKQLLLPDKKIFGIAGKIGHLDMKGNLNVYEDFDNQNETLKIAIKDFTFGFAITNIENLAKIVLD